MAEQGSIVRTDGSRQSFFEKSLLNNYLDAFEEAKAKLLADHETALAAEDAKWQAIRDEAARQRQQYAAQEQHRAMVQAAADAVVEAETQKAADVDDTKVVRPDGCGQARRGWKGGSYPRQGER